MRKTLFSGIAACLLATAATAAEQSPSVIWTVGQADRSASEFALAPDRFRDFLANDFGYEDKYFLVGHSVPAADFPYVLPTRGAAHGPRRAGARIRSISSSD